MIINVEKVSKSFRLRGNKKLISGLFDPQWKSKTAVKNISFAIAEGESVAFLGPNGAGKTTTTKMMTGLIAPSNGRLTVLGYEPFNRNHEFLKSIGLVMGNRAGLNWDLTAMQSFDLLQKIYEIPESEIHLRIGDLSTMLKVDNLLDTQVRKLSLGERMKLELIAAILHDPKILFLDEPTIGLDIEAKRTVRAFLRHINSSKTIILTSHDMDDIAEVCQRVIVISKGRILYDDTMASLNSGYADTKYARLEFADAPPSKKYLKNYCQVLSTTTSGAHISAPKGKMMDALSEIHKHHALADMTIEPVPLEIVIGDLFESAK